MESKLFKKIAESFDSPFMVIDKLNIVYLNKNAEKLLKINDSEETLDKVFNKYNYKKIKEIFKSKKSAILTNIKIKNTYFDLSIKSINGTDYTSITFKDISTYFNEKLLKDCIFKISKASHYVEDLDQLYIKIHHILSDVIYTKNFYIAIADWENNLIKFPYFVDKFDKPPQTKEIENGLTEYVIKTGQSILVNPAQSTLLTGSKKINMKGTESIDWLGVPLKIGESNKTTFGAIVVQSYNKNIRFTEDDKKILLFVSDQIAMAIKRKIDYLEITKQAFYDHLTGLANKILFNDRLEQAIFKCHRNKTKVAVLFIDLDNFKFINDSMGHTAGDELLKVVSKRLNRCLRKTDTISRWGGDEFTVILPEIKDLRHVLSLCTRILKTELKNIVIDNQELRITASIGISFYPDDGEDVESLIKNADTAMYKAKELGKNQYQLYKEEMNQNILERISYENRLFNAIEKKEFILLYQPQIDLKTNEIIGFEALIRWISPEMGLLSPYKFIPIAEETNLILPLGKWILEQTCIQNKKWHDLGYKITSAVNISAKQFLQDDMLEIIKNAIKKSGLNPAYLDLEVTETTIMDDVKQAIKVLEDIKELGINISIDDFGTGYSSLSYLKKFPIDTLKIDQSFISTMDTLNPSNTSIANLVIDLGHKLGMNVIAEGVETQEQVEFLKKYACDKIQGYIISEPVNEVEFTLLLDKTRN